ncbi:apolipoprotein N-acyltransferase [Falsochrobactrum shanghaiense]|uniref:Apolipoprotein N-acyltransferase n=1 Tax=Falsochrobactrum shanghaiense TaxID=2201899 RepID=A0A316JJL0_9HYPH|nr:apolipoprotein N-acyltransferase [Falsochrobactrum shanghaiense]PWL19463.1 apolipoprotein N-acyltransferase [Falsochrobactrum shanghaiense]
MINGLGGRIRSLSGWQHALAAFLAGAFLTLTQPPFDILFAGFVSFPLLVWLIDASRFDSDKGLIRRLLPAAITGWWFGFGYFVAGLWWIGAALLVDADEFAWALPLAVLGLPAFLALFHAFAAMVARLFWSDGLGRILALAFGFGLAEWLRSFLFTGFPWNALGYALMPTPMLMQSAAIAGLTGMGVLAVFLFASPALLAGGRLARSGLFLAAFLAAGHVFYGAWVLAKAPPMGAEETTLSVRIVQPSIAQSLKWDDGERRAIFDKFIAMSKQPPAAGRPVPDVIVWPETAVPYILSSTPDALARIADMVTDEQVLLTGAVREETVPRRNSRYYNSILAINSHGRITDYSDKVHLVPFGEYLPFERLLRSLGLQEVVEMPGGFTPARARHAINVMEGQTFLPLICYEAIFPDELGYTGRKPTAIINVTNDAWYGDTPGPYQHFRQAQIRSVEQGLPMVRAANNGISAIVDAYGRITEELPLDAVDVIDAYLPQAHVPFWGRSPSGREALVILSTLLIACLWLRLPFSRRFH